MSLSVASVDQFINFGLHILIMQVSKKPMLQDSNVILGIRIAFLISCIVQVMFYFFIKTKIAKTNDQRKIKVKKEQSLFQENDGEEEVEMTNQAFDMAELVKAGRSAVLQSLFISVLHLKWNVLQPLIVQILTPIKNLLINPLYTAYVWNQPILRPYDKNCLFQKLETEAPKVEEVTAAPEKKRKKEE